MVKNSSHKSKPKRSAWRTRLINNYFVKPEATSSIPITSSSADSASSTPDKTYDNSCVSEGCKKLRSSGCINKLCFTCCYTASKARKAGFCENECVIHLERAERELESKRMFDAMVADMQGKRDFNHQEEKLSKVCQTVVVWCLKDFIENKKWCEEVFERHARKQRQRRMLQRRSQLNVKYVFSSEDSALSNYLLSKTTEEAVSHAELQPKSTLLAYPASTNSAPKASMYRRHESELYNASSVKLMGKSSKHMVNRVSANVATSCTDLSPTSIDTVLRKKRADRNLYFLQSQPTINTSAVVLSSRKLPLHSQMRRDKFEHWLRLHAVPAPRDSLAWSFHEKLLSATR